MAPSIAILVLINGAPLAFFIVIKCNHSLLADEERKKSFGAIYNGKNVSKDDHRAQFYPLGFFWRRMLFIIITGFVCLTLGGRPKTLRRRGSAHPPPSSPR